MKARGRALASASTILLVVAFGCGSSSETTTQRQDAGETSAPPRQLGDGTVTCRSTTCDGRTGQRCCAGFSDGGIDVTCAATCPPSYIALGCDGREDCGGNACCGSSLPGWGCSTTA